MGRLPCCLPPRPSTPIHFLSLLRWACYFCHTRGSLGDLGLKVPQCTPKQLLGSWGGSRNFLVKHKDTQRSQDLLGVYTKS